MYKRQAQQAEDLYQGTVVTRQETQDSITYTLKEDLSFSGFRTEDTVFAGSVLFKMCIRDISCAN